MREEGKIVAGQPIHNRTREYRRVAQHPAHAKKYQQSGRRLLKLSFGILIICAFIWCWQKITNPQTLPIRTVQITGVYEKVDHNELRQLILPFVDKGFLWADTSALQDRLQQLPWIYTASVKRTWPNKLVINLAEQKPIARIGGANLVNEEGDVFAVDQSTIPAGLPLFISPLPGQQKLILDNYKTMSATLAPLSVKIVAISLDARQSWSVQLDNGIVVIMGKVEPIPRLQRFVHAYSQIVGANAANINIVDLRYASGIAVRFKNQTKATLN
jgi:cell division protein FtsQ